MDLFTFVEQATVTEIRHAELEVAVRAIRFPNLALKWLFFFSSELLRVAITGVSVLMQFDILAGVLADINHTSYMLHLRKRKSIASQFVAKIPLNSNYE